MNDDELLLKYKSYVRKRNIIIIISIVIFLFLIFLIFRFAFVGNEQSIPLPSEQQVVDEDEKPTLELSVHEVTIELNESIDYMSYLKEASDEVDGDLKEKVQYTEIDTSIIGEHNVLYYVFDSSNNMAQAVLKVIVIESTVVQEEQELENNSDEMIIPPIAEEEIPTENSNDISSDTSSTKYFLFEDGYTMENVVDACSNELNKYNGAGRCEPITDENGIYLGMKMILE